MVVRLTALAISMTLSLFAFATLAYAETTSDYLEGCKTNVKACRDYMFFVSVSMKMDKAKRDLICLSKGWKAEEVSKTILDWLGSHPELAGEPAATSIEKAFLAKYAATEACRATYARPDPFPATIGQFLSYCEAEPSDKKGDTCHDEFLTVELDMRIDNPDVTCRVKADPKDKAAFRTALVARTAAVRKWLVEHKEVADRPRREGIATAYKALFSPPCAS